MTWEEERAKIKSESPEMWLRLRKKAQAIAPDPSPFRFRHGPQQFQSRYNPSYFELWRFPWNPNNPPPRLDCRAEFEQFPFRIEVRGHDGYDPPEPCYSFEIDDDGNVFLRPSLNPDKKLSAEDAALNILLPFLEKYK